MAGRVDGARVALIFESTRGLRACPDELIRDGVAVFGGDVDGEMEKAAGDFMSPVPGVSGDNLGEKRYAM